MGRHAAWIANQTAKFTSPRRFLRPQTNSTPSSYTETSTSNRAWDSGSAKSLTQSEGKLSLMLRSDFGFSEEDYSRTFKFYLDDETEPCYMAFQYSTNGTVYIFRNLGQSDVNHALRAFDKFRTCYQPNIMTGISGAFKATLQTQFLS